MRPVLVVASVAMALAGCSGVQSTFSSLSKGGGGSSIDAAAQNECQERFQALGSGPVTDCTRELSRQRRAEAAAGAAPAK